MALFTASRLQVLTYLLGICPFSIAFLVFLNSSVSFVVTDLIGRRDGIGDAVGNLGFADELIALVACPFWGLLSDRIGVRSVCVLAYAIIGLALIVFVQAKNVYPQLLLARLFFSLGGAAATTMVTAVLPTMSYIEPISNNGPLTTSAGERRHIHAASTASELTITPARFHSTRSPKSPASPTAIVAERSASTSKISGFVGTFTGLGALVALIVFLPLPAFFQGRGIAPGKALQHAYYIVAAIALILSVACLFGLRNLQSDSEKAWRQPQERITTSNRWTRLRKVISDTARNLYTALLAGFQRTDIGIGYLGGFVARASSIGISLFIPLLVNALFTSSGICKAPPGAGTPHGLPEIKRKCPQAYILASILSGVAESVALVSAPLFGYWSARTKRKTLPLAVSAIAGILGYPLFAARFNPDASNKADRAAAFIAVCFIGFSQIGAIVCSLASIGIGVLADVHINDQASLPTEHSNEHHATSSSPDLTEAQPLLHKEQHLQSLSGLKGSVAGVYSFFGGAAILILTKLGGYLFDAVSTGSPFYIMAVFNGMLLVASIIVGLRQQRASKTN